MPLTRTTREHFNGVLWPPELLNYLLNALLSGSPFADSLTRLGTDRGAVAFPTAAPEAGGWTAEGAPIPKKELRPDVDVVAVCKLASLHSITNEAIDDTSFPLAQEVGRMLRDADGPELDKGLLYGAGGTAPDGVVAKATAAGGAADFRQAAIKAWSELVAAGAGRTTTTVFAHPGPIGDEWSRVNDQGTPIHEDQDADTPLSVGPGITVVPVPTLQEEDVLAVDVASVFFIERDRLSLELSPYADDAWVTDSQSLRVKLRAAVGAPLPAKSLRKVTISGGNGQRRTTAAGA